VSDDTAKLMEGILGDARAEADRIQAETETAAQGRVKAARLQAASLVAEGKQKAEEAVQQVRRIAGQTTAVMTRRIDLRVREGVYTWTVEQASRGLAGLIGTPGYRDVLVGWIAEAAIGLDAADAEVLASPVEMEMIDQELLGEAETQVQRVTGKPVSLHRSTESPPVVQGVVLSSTDGRTAYNNQVPTRFLRHQSQIRKLISQAMDR